MANFLTQSAGSRRDWVRTLTTMAGLAGMAGLALALTAGQARAQADYPNKPVKVIVPFPAGTSPDVVARLWAERLSQALGQPFVVDNRPGAATIVGAQAAATAPADGYTLLYTAQNTVSINPFVYKNLPYKADDFVPISQVAEVPLLLITSTKSNTRTLQEMIAQAKQNQGKFNFASFGIGQGTHVVMQRVLNAADIRMTHVPYRDGGMNDVIAGNVDFSFDASTTAIPQIKAGKLRALAVSSTRRLDALPDVPTIAESIPGFMSDSWTGVLVRRGAPREVIQKISSETAKILASESFQKRLSDVGLRTGLADPAEFARFIANESVVWSKVVRDNNISVEQ